jgi:hypothetical protein
MHVHELLVGLPEMYVLAVVDEVSQVLCVHVETRVATQVGVRGVVPDERADGAGAG